jgi:hypothetical protein
MNWRLRDELRRSDMQLRDERQRYLELKQKLDALIEIERRMRRDLTVCADERGWIMNEITPSGADIRRPVVLLVDDDADLLALVSMRIGSAGYEVGQCHPRKRRCSGGEVTTGSGCD